MVLHTAQVAFRGFSGLTVRVVLNSTPNKSDRMESIKRRNGGARIPPYRVPLCGIREERVAILAISWLMKRLGKGMSRRELRVRSWWMDFPAVGQTCCSHRLYAGDLCSG